MSSTRNSQNLLTNVFRPTYVYTDGSGFTAGVVATNLKTLDVPTVRTNILDIGDDGSNVYLGTNAGVLYSTNATNTNVSAFGVNAAAGISNVSNSVFIGTAAGLGMTNATDTTVIGANDAVIGTRNVVIGNRDFIFGSNNIVIGSDVSISESFKLNIANLIIGDIGSDVCGAALIFNSDVKINGTFTSTLFDASGISVNDLAVPGYIRNDPNFGIVMDISQGNFAFSGSGPSRVAGVVFSNYRIDASQGIYGEGYDLSTNLFLSGDISANGAIRLLSSTSNQIGGVTLSNSNIIASRVRDSGVTFDMSGGNIRNISNTTSSNFTTITASSNSIGGVTLSNNNISNAGTTTSSNFVGTASASNSIGGTTLSNGYVRSGAGTSNAPSYSFSTDTSSGFYSPSASNLGIVTAGIERMRIASNGNVVIGDRFFFYPDFNNLPSVGLCNGFYFASGYNSPNSGRIIYGDGTGWRMHFSTKSGATVTDRITITDAGSVGIGTTAPSVALDVSGTTNPGIRMFSGTSNAAIDVGNTTNTLNLAVAGATGAFSIAAAVGDVVLRSLNGTGKMFLTTGPSNSWNNGIVIASNGNVGIGTSNPQYLLDLSSGTASQGIRVTANNPNVIVSHFGTSDLALFNNGLVQGLYTTNTVPLSLYTNGSQRLTILSNGNVGIGTTAPVTRLDISSTSDSAGGVRITNFSTISNTRVIDALMPNIPNTTGRVQILMGKNFSNPNNYATLAYCHLGGDSSASNYMGLGTPTGDGLIVNQSGNVGIGTTAPAYRLDVSATAGTAAVNMNTWPRVPIGNVLILRNIAASSGYVGNTANFASNIQAIDSNLATVVSSNTTNGASFTIQKSGIWSISWNFNSSTTGVFAFIDVSTNNNSNVGFNAAGNPVIAFEQAPGGSGVLTWTGYLPSNNTYIYKMRISATPNNISNGLHFILTFLAETPTSASSFPF